MIKNFSANKNLYFNCIFASCLNGGIGFKNKIPWYIPNDFLHFKKVTSSIFDKMSHFDYLKKNLLLNLQNNDIPSIPTSSKKNMVVMGMNTYHSIGKLLPNRINVILSDDKQFKKSINSDNGNVFTVSSHNEVFNLARVLRNKSILNEIFVIGGGRIFNDFLSKYNNQCKMIFRTLIQKDFKCDSFVKIPTNFQHLFISQTFSHKNIPYDFRILANNNLLEKKIINEKYLQMYPPNQEMQYLNLIKKILEKGVDKSDRTGVGTRSLFGVSMKFDLSQSFPLLTTKKTFWRGIVEELLWFIKGDTNAKHLQEKNVHIWDGNSSRQYLDSIGLKHREEGDLGPVYGFQWRHFGAKYKTMYDNYSNQGIDQLKNVINTLQRDPNNRRIIMSAWNPVDLSKMALPPCHILSQFYVYNNRLNLQMYQRSADMGLGVPFNIASYSLLLRMVAQVTGLLPGEFTIVIGDAHIYKNHIKAMKEQIKRIPYAFPVLTINKRVKDIEKFTYSDFKLNNYKYHSAIKMKMAV